MRVFLAIALFTIFPSAAWAQAPLGVAEILQRVGRNYKAVSRYELIVDATEDGSRETYHMEFAFKAPDKYRMQGSIPALSVPDPSFKQATIVYDGSDVWFYFPKSNQYGSFPSSALKGDLGDLKPEAIDRFMMGRFRRAADFAHSAELLREEPIAKSACFVVIVLTGDNESPYTWWIDKTRAIAFCARTTRVRSRYSRRSGWMSRWERSCSNLKRRREPRSWGRSSKRDRLSECRDESRHGTLKRAPHRQAVRLLRDLGVEIPEISLRTQSPRRNLCDRPSHGE